MAESVTVDHGGVSITTNTASEADLRTEMTAPAEVQEKAQESAREAQESARETIAPPPSETPRDEKGRFARAEPPPPAAEAEAPEPTPDQPGSRRRDPVNPHHNPIARLNQALAQKAEVERKAAQLEAELARYRQPTVIQPVTPPAATNGQEPQFEQFGDAPDPYTAYLQAWTRWDRAQGIAQARAEWEAAQTEKARTQTFQLRLAEGKTQYADFDKVLTDADTLGLQVSAVMQEAIADSPHAADLVYYLATHPEECTQLAARTQYIPVAAATEVQENLELRLQLRGAHLAPSAAPAKTGSGSAVRAAVSTAKPPVMPVGSSPVVSDEPPGDSASAAEHARYWNRRLKVPGTK